MSLSVTIPLCWLALALEALVDYPASLYRVLCRPVTWTKDRFRSALVDAANRHAVVSDMSEVTEAQRSLMQSLFDAYGDDELAVCDAYAEAERAGKIARPDEDRGEFAESYARGLWRIGKAEGWLA